VAAPDRTASKPALALAERPASLVQLMARKGKASALAAGVKAALGLDLPPPGKWAAGAGADAIWIEPGGWLLMAEPAPPGAFRAKVAAAAGDLGAAVDQSSGRSVIRLEGAPARSVFATLCRLDLHPRVFGPGSAATTRVGHVTCTIRLVDETPSFDLIVGSTYARWVIEELLEASHAHGARLDRGPGGSGYARPAPGASP
jgi:heterotetrameric sarcosine oxidase gamma subunit